MDLGWLDLVLAVLIVSGAVRGFGRGFLREGMAFGGLALGMILASEWHSEVASWLRPFIGGGRLTETLGYLLVVLVILGGATMLTVALLRLLRHLLVAWLDRVGGILFGAVEGAVSGILLLLLLLRFPVFDLDESVKGSEVAGMLLGAMPGALALLPPELAPVVGFFESVKTP